MKRHHEPPVVLYFSGFPGWLAWFSLQMFCLNNKIHFSLANANNSASFKRKMVLNHRFCSFTTTNKLVNEAANDSARVSGQDRKKPPALGTNEIAGFGGFRSLASLEKNKWYYFVRTKIWRTCNKSACAGTKLGEANSDLFRFKCVFWGSFQTMRFGSNQNLLFLISYI